MSKVELEVINKIKERLKNNYTFIENMNVPNTFTTSTIFIKLKYDFKVLLSLRFTKITGGYEDFEIVLSCGNTRQTILANTAYISYLNDIETCLNKLIDQIHAYEEFIKDFTEFVVNDLYNVDYHINLNTLHTYFKSYNGRAVIYPKIEFGHGGEYVTMYIDSIDGGNYPMKLYSSISYEDAKEMLGFFL